MNRQNFIVPRGHHGVAGATRQRGVSLVIVLVLLIVMSVLGVAVLRSSALQERMGAMMPAMQKMIAEEMEHTPAASE